MESSSSLTESFALESFFKVKAKACLAIIYLAVLCDCRDVEYTKCRSCNKLIARVGASAKAFNAMNLVNHLKSKHCRKLKKFKEIT